MKTSKVWFLMLFLLAGVFTRATVQAPAQQTSAAPGVPYPDSTTPYAVDLGQLKAQAGTTPMAITVALRMRSASEAEALLKAIHTPGDPQFHHFLSAAEFDARFAPTASDVGKVVATLSAYGLTAEQTSATTLKVTGLPADMERAFAVSLHSYQVPAHGNTRTYTFHAPLSRPTIPSELATSVSAVAGLDTRPSLRPLYHSASQQIRRAPPAAMPAATGNPLGSLTVADFANDYDIQPLYKRGVTGKGRTLAIATLASFTPSDAFAYWSALKLKVDKNRIKIVDVDGGPGSPSDASGSFETTIDVEQSGGIAPGANIIVYQAPNTNQGFVDLFAAAVDSNAADTISVSWGFWEWYQNLENSPVTDPITGKSVGLLNAFHELFVRAAIQGQTLFAASGDGGAYDANNDFGCSPESTPSCSTPLTVDNPASDTAMTAAGGTTLPGLQEYCLNSACTPPYYDINLTHERVWGWDYLNGYCSAVGVPDPIACGTFPGGSGGGVSIIFAKPAYQYSLQGVQRSQPGQHWIYDGTLTYVLPSNYAGRNVPDVSFNADPQTGYVVYYTSNVGGFSVQSYWGGTSFVAPQLNGVSALLGDYLHGSRLGLLNYPLYGLALSGEAYGGPNPPLHAIAYGDNWFYHGANGYNPGAGLGTLDVANFARVLGNLF